MNNNAKTGISSFADSFLRGYELGHRIRRENAQDERDASFDDLRRTNAELQTQTLRNGVSMLPVEKQIKEAQLAEAQQAIRLRDAELGNVPINQKSAQLSNQSKELELEMKRDEKKAKLEEMSNKINARQFSVMDSMPVGKTVKLPEMKGSFLDSITSAANDSGVPVELEKTNDGFVLKTSTGGVHKLSADDYGKAKLFTNISATKPSAVTLTYEDGTTANIIMGADGKYEQVRDQATTKEDAGWANGGIPADAVDLGGGMWRDSKTGKAYSRDVQSGADIPKGRVTKKNKDGVDVRGVDANYFASDTTEAVDPKTDQIVTVDVNDVDGVNLVSLYDTGALTQLGYDPLALNAGRLVRRSGGVPASPPVDEASTEEPVASPDVIEGVLPDGTTVYYDKKTGRKIK